MTREFLRADWRRSSPPCDPLDWHTEWQDERHGGWRIESAVRTDGGWERTNLRLRMGETPGRLTGAACVCVREDGPEPRILLVRQDRPAPGIRCWELPSGMVDEDDDSPAQSALRELAEETGAHASLLADLGEIYPDVGVFGAAVHVVLATFEFTEPDAEDVEQPEVATTRWFTRAQVDHLIATGDLRDGVTLAALALAAVYTGGPRTPRTPPTL